MTALSDRKAAGDSSPAVAQPRLAVTRVMLTNFRSYAVGEIATSGRPVVLAGPNGAGKTNLLDAISLLSPGRGLRGTRLGEHTRKGPAASSEALWGVAATVSRGDESYEIGTGLTLGPNGGERRQMRLNGAPASNPADMAELVQMAWLTPAMDRLFIEGASGRRRFLDRLVFGFTSIHARNATRYETAMRERARLLKFGPRDPAWLDGLEAEMTQAGIAVAQARAEAVVRLNRALAERGEAGEFPSALLSLEGDADALIAEHGNASADAFREHFARARIRDAEAGRTTFGPHLSDLGVRHTARRMDAHECSTGEQKALLISIVLAHAWELSHMREGRAPILLLDEIAAHLDVRRRAALFGEILALGAQAWMTGTDMDMFLPLKERADLFAVSDSRAVLISE
ncbi:MAG TPA: DNA replication/repair protein RecF [Rhizomicrobium sp.]|nr:DNA replication/repair protein RecF [Rhizomicrobium sp.]